VTPRPDRKEQTACGNCCAAPEAPEAKGKKALIEQWKWNAWQPEKREGADNQNHARKPRWRGLLALGLFHIS
jgi:hypothetical protein